MIGTYGDYGNYGNYGILPLAVIPAWALWVAGGTALATATGAVYSAYEYTRESTPAEIKAGIAASAAQGDYAEVERLQEQLLEAEAANITFGPLSAAEEKKKATPGPSPYGPSPSLGPGGGGPGGLTPGQIMGATAATVATIALIFAVAKGGTKKRRRSRRR